jgi:hypothetical protein
MTVSAGVLGDVRYNRHNFVASFIDNPRGQFGVYAVGYRLAAETVVESLVRKGGFRDYEAYPVVYLYRHAFELHLKNIVYRVALLLSFNGEESVDTDYDNQHALCPLAERASAVLEKAFPDDAGLKEVIGRIDAIAKDFDAIDKQSFAYRYPIDKRGAASTRKHQTLNLRALAEHMCRLLDDLEAVDSLVDFAMTEATEQF